MNKKKVITQKNIMKVADFLENACDHFKRDEDGCFRFRLNGDLAIYVGWSGGYDMADTDIIKSAKSTAEQADGMITGYAVNAAVKVRNDDDWCDFDYLDFPTIDGEVYDSGTSVRPDLTRRGYRNLAKWLLGEFVGIVNAQAA